MKIQLTTEEVKKAVAFYTREKLIPHSEYRNINEVEINEKGASLVVTNRCKPDVSIINVSIKSNR